MTRVAHRLGFAALIAAVGLGCSGAKQADSDQTCETSANCGSQGSECLVGVCVPHALDARTWFIEIVPAPAAPDAPPDGGSSPVPAAALTELPDVIIGNDPAQLSAEATFPVTISFAYAATAPVPANANVVLTVPPGIPGRPDLRFEGAMEDGRSVTVSVPKAVLDRAGAVQLLPWPSETLPPSSFAIARVGDPQELAVGASVSVRGTLRDAFDRPVPADSFAARAFQEGALVSNSTTVDELGRFSLQLSAAAAAKPVTIGFIPRMNSSSSGDPSFSSADVTVTPSTTFDVTLPPYITMPNQFTLEVLTSGEDPAALIALPVRATTDLAPSPLGTTTFSWEAATGADGVALLALLPGTMSDKREYFFTVSPRAGSKYATYCTPKDDPVSVTAGGPDANSAVPVRDVTLSLRPVVFGNVTNYTGKPVGNVVVTATLVTPADPSCPPGYSSVSATTGLDGRYRLSLNPGRYRLDYDPAPGAPVPRLTDPEELEVTGDLSHNVALPRAESVQGIVHGPDGSPLPTASVRFYELCGSSEHCLGPNRNAPWLRARAQSDANGHFFAVVPGL